MSGFADQIGDGSISTLESAASWRLAEAGVLRANGRYGAALYLLGYVAEMRLTAACCRLLGYSPEDLISVAALERMRTDARKLKLMTAAPHDVRGWGRYLIELRRRRRRWFGRGIQGIIERHADSLYAHWRPRLRYKTMTPTAAQLKAVLEAAEWFNSNYSALWR
jgi:hypothetical protein